jgi:hypothetical protein
VAEIVSEEIAYNKNRMKTGLLLILAALCTLPALAQPVRVFSEFAQIDANGNVVAPEFPREILSPAIPRNGFTSYQVVIQIPEKTKFLMYVGQNPENAVKVAIYHRKGDQLEPVELPYESEGTQILWMDIWVDRNAPVRRVKVEPQVNIANLDWVIYPMEVRVREPQIPDTLAPTGMRTLLCGGIAPIVKTQGAEPVTVEQMHLRNERQDAALAAQATAADRDELKKRLGGCSAKSSPDPETYLKARDLFFTPLWMRVQKSQ